MLPTPWKPNEWMMPFASLRKQMDRMFDNFFEEWPSLGPDQALTGGLYPPIDLRETDDAILVEAELPGMNQKDISVEVEDGTLTIKGERKHEEEKKTGTVYRKECVFGTFQRQIPLPVAVERDKVEAAYSDGILKITLPRVPGAKPKIVQVKVK